MQLAKGEHLGPYEIVSPIGAGGMGEVWRARDSRIGRDVAVKVLPPSFARDADRLLRFEQEAKTAGTLNHPNLVTIHDFGTHEGAPYIVMELLEGQTLREKLEGSALPPRKAIEYAVQMANALAAAHDRGIVHRDLKPENVFITNEGRLKILDFGLAKLAGPGPSADDRTQQKVTAPGTVMGTAGYMSPEQVRGEDVDHRSDIFALGAIVYEMLARRRAFHAPTSVETMNAILREDPPEIDSSTGRIPPAIDRLVRRCLEKNREERFHSAHDVAYALDVVSSGSGSSGQPALTLRTRRWLMPLLVVAGFVASAGIGFVAARRQPPAPATSQAPPHFTQLTFDAGIETHASIAPDGKSFAYTSNRTGNFDIYVQRTGGTNPVNLTPGSPATDSGPAFSPDGQLIAFSSSRNGGEGLYVMGATGESVRRLTEFGFDPSWSPDGKRIAFANEGVLDPYVRRNESTLWIVDVASGMTRKIEGAGDAVQPSWSPNGTRIAYWCSEQGRRVIKTIPAAGGKPTSIMTEVPFNWNPVWSADGKTLFFGSDRNGVLSLWRIAIDEASGETRGEAQPLTAGSEPEGFLSVARDGTTVFRRARAAGQIYEVPYDPKARRITGPPVALLGGSRAALHVDLSPDRQWVVFSSGGAQEDLFAARLDGSELRQITNDTARDRIPRWSPDGSRIAFYSSRGGDYDLWTIRPDGGDARQLTRGRNAYDPVWSPDGKFITLRTRDGDVILVTATGEPSVRPLGPAKNSFYPTSWTADGTRICGRGPAADSAAGAAGRPLIFDVRSGKLDAVGDPGGWAVCVGNDTLLQQDGSSTAAFGREVRLKAIDLRTKQVTDAGSLGSLYWRAGAVARDGRSIVAPSNVTEADIWLMRWPERSSAKSESNQP